MLIYHAIDPSDNLFRHNIAINKGRITAVSLARLVHPEWESILSPYEAFTCEREKEEAFEKIRASEYDNCPTRLGSIFAFPTKETANRSNSLWFNGKRVILEGTVTFASRIGTFDSQLLNARQEDWEVSARTYWSGKLSGDPFPEVLIDGVIQLSGWEPYGLLFAGLGNAGGMLADADATPPDLSDEPESVTKDVKPFP
jgi:hypothetical protein